jgi:hypothetical protein
MTTAQKILVTGVAVMSLAAAMLEPAEARRRGRYYYHHHYYSYAPAYSYRSYGGYYGAAYGYGRCHTEMEGHLGPKTCAYRY